MRAVVAFCSRVIFRLHKDRVIRTRLRAGFAADTTPVVEINDAVRACIKRGHGTNLDTRRVGAMIATHHAKKPARIGKFSFFDIFDPSPIDTDRNLVFRFTRHRASVAANTFAIIYDKSKVHFFERLADEI